ncbi:MAG: chitobiase/beta-hexosaminidase C-terminal domain-containing protein, partial [Thermodesulfobacteriota bacterium]
MELDLAPADLEAIMQMDTSQIDLDLQPDDLATLAQVDLADLDLDSPRPELVATPGFSPKPGTYSSEQSIVIASVTPETKIHYTEDGSEPTESSPVCVGLIKIKESVTIKARAYKTGFSPSQTSIATYIITGQVFAPTFSIPPGLYHEPLKLVLVSQSRGADIHYTLDGGEPSRESTAYTVPIEISKTTVIKARAYLAGMKPSDIVTAEYSVDLHVAVPVFDPPPGSFTSTQNVNMWSKTHGAVIHYTLDGRTPTENDPIFAEPLVVSKLTTVRSRAFKQGLQPSQVAIGVYDITGQVEAPIFSPEPGQYSSPIILNLSCPTRGALIHYTVDGREPTEDSPVYNRPLKATKSVSVKAKAFKPGWKPSDIAAATFTISGQVESPKIIPASGIYPRSQGVKISSSTQGAIIRYTLDGSEPTEASLVYSEPVLVSVSATIKARAFRPGWAPSQVASAVYEITGTVAAPVFSPGPGTFIEAPAVSLSCATPGADIRYTLDGSEPCEASPHYSEPIMVSASAAIKARAFKPGWAPSQVDSAVYEITGTVALPAFSPGSGTFIEAPLVSLSCATAGVDIRYTLDGGEPGEASPLYSEPIAVAHSAAVKARAFKPGWASSQVASAVYEITGTVAAPVFSPGPGTFIEAPAVSLSCATAGADIRYTQDGSEPGEASPLYSGPVLVSVSATIKARAFKPGWAPSQVASAVYEITGTVAAPVFSPDSGTFIEAPQVSISCATAGADIRYTLDGGEPCEASPHYSEPIAVAHSAAVKARAFKPGWAPSQVASAVYEITGTVAAPVFSPGPGTFIEAPAVSLSCATAGADIRYTLDGGEPCEASPHYSEPIMVSASAAIKARAFKPGWAPSQVASAVYEITGTVAAPVFSPGSGTFIEAPQVSISCSTPGADIRYTLDGGEPSEASPHYSEPVLVSVSAAIKARAFKPGWASSELASAVYEITGTVASPVFSPDSGTFIEAPLVSISCATAGADIRYTLDGSEPTEASPLYSEPIMVSSSAAIKARAFKPGWAPSQVASAVYEITGTVALPAFSPGSGTFIEAPLVSLSCATSDTDIRYTLDGSEPGEASPLYSEPIAVAHSAAVKARAFKPGWASSQVVLATYEITGTVAAPVFSPGPGTFIEAPLVSLSCATAGADIRYTQDGSEPTEASPLYSEPIMVTASAAVKARAFKPGWAPSQVASAVYEITGTVAAPVFSPDSGTFIEAPLVSLSCATAGVDIRYTLDGGEPGEASPLYSEPIAVAHSAAVKARAFKPGWAPSELASAAYEITGTVAAPVFSPDSGTFIEAPAVSLSCATAGADIRYTLDGGEPGEASPLYSEPIAVTASAAVKARAF